jgi:DDE superfamily endonuclease
VLVFADEFTVSLLGRVVRVWGPIGEEVRQRLDLGRDSAQGALAVDPISGELDWQWLSRGTKDRAERARAVAARDGSGEPPPLTHWLDQLADVGVRAVVWDDAGSHRDGWLRQHASERGLQLVKQPPASPELNPAERVIEGIRAATEGRVFENLESKLVAVEGVLNELALDPEGVRQLTRWDWILKNIQELPP